VREVTLTTWPGFFWQTDAGDWADTDEPWDIDPYETRVGVCKMKCQCRWRSVRVWNLPAQETRRGGASAVLRLPVG
jgi:hypothetical protein